MPLQVKKNQSLQEKINEAGGPERMLRSASAGHYPFPIESEHTSWRDEQKSLLSTAVLFDQSHHMTDIYFKGPDVRRLFSDVGMNDFTNFGKNKAKQFVACNTDGYFLGDAILFGLDDDEYSLVGAPTAPHWVAYQAAIGGYDVDVTTDERTLANFGRRKIFRFQLQGPRALDIIDSAAQGGLKRIKFFNIGEFTIADTPIRGLNHTMVGVPGDESTGLEMWGPADRGPAVLEALVEAGQAFGMRQGGAIAYSTVSLESGWIGLPVPAIYSGESMRPYREFLRGNSYEGNASLVGSFTSDNIDDYCPTPWDLGYGRLINLEHDFIGCDALKAMAADPHRRKVWLVWNDDDVARLIAHGLFEREPKARHLEIPYAVYGTYQNDVVMVEDTQVGLSGRAGYTVNIGSFASLAMIDEGHASEGTEVILIWGDPKRSKDGPDLDKHTTFEVRASIRHTPPRPTSK